MIPPMLAIDKDKEVSAREQAVSDKRGVPTVRVESMQDAIEMHCKQTFLYTIINADNIDYKPLFKVLRDVSTAPIFIIITEFKVCDQTEAFMLGANGYAPFYSPEENFDSIMAVLHIYHHNGKHQKEKPGAISFHKFLFYPKFFQSSYNDQELSLTNQEFKLFCYFIKNQGIKLTYTQIYENVWGKEFVNQPHNVLNCAVRRLRGIINGLPETKNYIKTIRGIGYKFDDS